MGTEGEMNARINAELEAKAKAAVKRVKARNEAAKKVKASSLKKVQAQIPAERRTVKPAAKPVTGVPGAPRTPKGSTGMAVKPAAGQAIMGTYTVKKGDTLGAIAKQFYGVTGPKYWNLIQSANKDLIKDVNLIYPGQVFKIPALPEDLKKK